MGDRIKGFREVKEYEDGNFRFFNCSSYILNDSCECSFGAVANDSKVVVGQATHLSLEAD